MRRCPPGAADPGRITVAARCILAASVLLAYPADPTFTAEAAAAPGPLVTFPDEPGPLVTGPTPRADATSRRGEGIVVSNARASCTARVLVLFRDGQKMRHE